MPEATEYSTKDSQAVATSALLDGIVFSEDDIEKNRNPLAKIDGRILPRYGKGPKYRTGRCKCCGVRCWPYATCLKHRAGQSIHRVMKQLVADQTVEIVKDGRGRRGGRTWQLTEEAKAKAEAEKAARTVRRTEPKIGRNAPCPCGSGRKYKACCLRPSNDSSADNGEGKTPGAATAPFEPLSAALCSPLDSPQASE